MDGDGAMDGAGATFEGAAMIGFGDGEDAATDVMGAGNVGGRGGKEGAIIVATGVLTLTEEPDECQKMSCDSSESQRRRSPPRRLRLASMGGARGVSS